MRASWLTTSGLTLSMMLAVGARAQTAPAPGAGSQSLGPRGTSATSQVGELIVTARRRAEAASSVPYNISVVSGAAIEGENLETPNEFLRTMPGVSVVDRGPRNAGQVDNARIRGINVDPTGLGDYSTVSVSPLSTYINDTPVFASFLLKDLSRIEVLRGPQSTLFGSGSLGGTIRYIQNEPSLEGFSGTVKSTQTWTANAGVPGWNGDLTLNVPFASTLAFRGTVSRLYDPGFIDYPNLYNIGPDGIQPLLTGGATTPTPSDFHSAHDVNDQRTWYAHGALLWQPTPALKLVANYTYQNDHVGGRQAISEGTDGFGNPYGRYDNGAVVKEPSARQVNVESLEATYDLGFATLTSSTSYFDHRGNSVTDNTGFYGHLIPGFPPGFLYYFTYYTPTLLPLTLFVNSYSDRAVVEEARLVSNPKAGHKFDYVVGVFFEDQHRGAMSQNITPGFAQTYYSQPGAIPGFVAGNQTFFYHRAEHFQEVAGFGELTWHVTSRLDLTGGVRYFHDDDSANALIGGGSLTRNNIFSGNNTELTQNKPLGKGNLSYRLDATDLFYATVAEGYRRGGSNAIPITGPQKEDPSYLNFGPDTTVDYEVGVKGRHFGINYSLAAYYIDWRNVQVNVATPTFGYYAVVNGKSAASKGLEAELSGSLPYGFIWSLGYALTDARLTADIITAGNEFTHVPAVSGRNGAFLPGVPYSSVNLSLSNTMSVGPGVTWTNRINGYYQSSTYNAVTPGTQYLTMDPFSLWGISSSLDWKDIEATLFVKNLFNAKGVSGVFSQAYSGSDLAANFYGNDSRDTIVVPRTVGLSLSYKF
jgi:outer membrane receptor protein involved in Fe transport